MNCCENCFKDLEIKSIIRNRKNSGTCDFCNSKNVFIYNLDSLNEDDVLKNAFENLIDVYSSQNNIPDDFPREKLDLLKNILHNQWNIFDISPDMIYRFLLNLFPDRYKEEPALFDNPVGISESIKDDYLQEYSLLGKYQWENFVDEIKSKNRFHTKILNTDILDKILQSSFKIYKKGEIFYRARVCDKNGLNTESMFAPPPNKASAGRANASGISCLYLANSPDTTLHEIRAGIYDFITVGKFRLLEDIEIVNLANIDKISPFKDLDSNLIAINLPHLKKIGQDIARPLRRYDSDLDYIPTQYICDYIKSKGFAGIEYKSTMYSGGINFAIFNENLFECQSTKLYDITALSYHYSCIE